MHLCERNKSLIKIPTTNFISEVININFQQFWRFDHSAHPSPALSPLPNFQPPPTFSKMGAWKDLKFEKGVTGEEKGAFFPVEVGRVTFFS